MAGYNLIRFTGNPKARSMFERRYLNGEIALQAGGAHLRGAGAEDLLQWTDAQWEKQRAARSKN